MLGVYIRLPWAGWTTRLEARVFRKLLVVSLSVFLVIAAPAQAQDLALGKPATASSTDSSPTRDPQRANDGDSSTRWSSRYIDNQWWRVDLGSVRSVNRVEVNWERAYASRYTIQTSRMGNLWSTVATVDISSPGLRTTTFATQRARYVRVRGVTRATQWGISFWDARVFGPGSASPPPQCSDGGNNDAPEDRLVDFPADPGCISATDDSESPNPSPPPPPDPDGDGVTGAEDQCPDQRGPASNNGCPVTSPQSNTKYGFHQGLGYFGDNSWWDPRLDATASIGSQVSRGTMLWSVVEPSNDNFSWTRYDALVAAIKARNMVPVFDLGRSPSWVNGSSDPWVIPSSQTAYDTWAAEYAEFAGRVAARYAGQGVLYEIWNEPNERYFWKGAAPSIDRYAQLFTQARDAMLSADPTAKVGLGGITGLGAGCCISGRDFISGLIDRGVQFDYAGIHPYVSGLDRGPDTHVAFEQNFDDISLIHNLLESRGRTAVKLWVTEWGWYGCSPDNGTKAGWLRRAHERIRDEWSSYVTISAYFMDSDESAYPCAGAFTSNLSRKPLANAFEAFMATVP
jgi:F5/8 type C domain/Glycosyl hydrolases family 39